MPSLRSQSRKQRQSRRQSRKQRQSRNRQQGGSAMSQSLAQGRDFLSHHTEQHGGGAMIVGAPVGDTGVLEGGLRSAAGLGKMDEAFSAIGGMKDQAGGRRRSRARKSRKSQKSRSRQQRRKSRQSGGCGSMPAAYGASTMLLDASTKTGAGNFNVLA